MEEKIEDVLKEYPIAFTGRKRIRGAILLEAEDAIYTLTNYKESTRRLLFQEAVKAQLSENGYPYVDLGIPNNRGELLTRDGQGNRMLLRQWFPGRECNLWDRNDVYRAAAHLAYLHNLLQGFQIPSEKAVILPEDFYGRRGDLSDEDGEEESFLEAASMAGDAEQTPAADIGTEDVAPRGDEGAKEDIEGAVQGQEIQKSLKKRKNEMKHAYNYIRRKKRKNEMELCILQQFQHFFEQAQEAEGCLERLDISGMLEQNIRQGSVCHGSYNYHNVLLDDQKIITTNFQNAELGIQINDLYDFLRKTMEKNNWNPKLGTVILEAYRKTRALKREEAQLLYILLLFPEKFWKQINFYYNGKKSWMSGKNYEKLLKIAAQEGDRGKFLQEAKGLLF